MSFAKKALAIGTLATLGVAASASAQSTLSGAGATFPAPFYQRAFAGLAGEGVMVNYQSVGSGAGVRQFEAGTVDFAASDQPLKAEDAAAIKRGVVQVPMTAGAIAVAYNNPGCSLKLSQAQLVGIFEGKITNFKELGCGDQAISTWPPLWLRLTWPQGATSCGAWPGGLCKGS
mgnify:CR=1 FL=1